jgi:putative component of membrane protein insertase Oxa1/YidC/SpoIIIJ protein YidD
VSIRLQLLSCCLLLCLLFSSVAALALEQRPTESGIDCLPPWQFARVDSLRALSCAESPEAVGPERLLLSTLMRTYRSVVSPVDGDRCSMYPSCSSYAQQAITEAGPCVGVMATCDRLLRCGNDARFYGLIRRDGRVLRSDAVDRSCRSSE